MYVCRELTSTYSFTHSFHGTLLCEVAEPESDEDFTRDEDDDVDSDCDGRDDNDMQSSEVNRGRSMMKSSFG